MRENVLGTSRRRKYSSQTEAVSRVVRPVQVYKETSAYCTAPTWKHSQYFLRHTDFLQLQPLR